MQSGVINKVAITFANVIDSKGFERVAPKQGVVHADKAYCDHNCQRVAKANNLHLCAIKKNKRKGAPISHWKQKNSQQIEQNLSKINS